jgi:hypothetical protein
VIKSAISDISFLNDWKHMSVHDSAMAIEGGRELEEIAMEELSKADRELLGRPRDPVGAYSAKYRGGASSTFS